MEKQISATEAVRNFSELMNTIKFTGDRYIINRSGKPVAVISPIESPPVQNTLRNLASAFATLPTLGEDAESFLADIEEARSNQPSLPDRSPWES
jgi:prevent-host-death family protein